MSSSAEMRSRRHHQTMSARIVAQRITIATSAAPGALRPKKRTGHSAFMASCAPKRASERRPAEAGLRGAVLWELAREGIVERVGRGLYRFAGADVTENVSLAEVAKAVPGGVICLLTALAFHELTTQLPHKVWMAVDRKARKPKARTVQLEIFRFSGPGLVEGVEVHRIEGIPVRITNPARTVADCFKYRNKVGLDVAMEALRDCLHDRKATVDELVRFAKLDRVWNVMRPYMEATV